MSQSSWLVAGMLPGFERQPRKKLEPSPERLLALLHRWRPRRTRARSPAAEPLRRARTCYDHLAGELGVALARALEERGLLMAGEGKGLVVTVAGQQWFAQVLGIETARLEPSRNGVARRCLDWTERRHHIAGPLGAALLHRFRQLGWITQSADSARAVKLSRRGAAALGQAVNISL